jgi:hypothetical protein
MMYSVYLLVRAFDVPYAFAQQFYRRIAKGLNAARVRRVARISTAG